MKTSKKSKKPPKRLPKNKTAKQTSISAKKMHDGKLTIMTFNVELFLRLYDFTMSGEDMVEDATIIHNKMSKFKKLFSNIDIFIRK